MPPLTVYAGGSSFPRSGAGTASGGRESKLWKIVPLIAFVVVVALIFVAGGQELLAAVKASGSFIVVSVGPYFGYKIPSHKPSPIGDGSIKISADKWKRSDAQGAPAQGAAGAGAKVPAAMEQQGSKAKEAKPAAKQAAAKPAAKPGKVKVLVEVDDKGKKLQILDAPLPDHCYPEPHADYDGHAVQWGLGHKVASAAQCCELCRTFKERNPAAQYPCNIWVWCGDASGRCWTMDIWNHTSGDCWLKYQEQWDNNPDRAKTNLKVNHRGKFADAFRAEHQTAPEKVPWLAGVIPAPK